MAADDTLTQLGGVLGTPAYMAPEQASGLQVDGRADLFSLGCVLYQMITGQKAFHGGSVMAVLKSLAADSPAEPRSLNPDCPPELSRLVMQLLEKEAEKRPASARHVGDTLARIAAAMPSAAEAPAEPAAAAPSMGPRAAARHGPRRSVVAAAVGLLLFGLAAWLFGGIVVRFATNKGEIVIATEDPDIEVVIKDEAGTITDRGTKRQYTVTAGAEHQVEVTVKDDRGEVTRFATKRFTVSRGGKEVLNVELQTAKGKDRPAAPLVSGPRESDPDRRAAEWVLSIGGEVHIFAQGKDLLIKAVADLPAGAFDLTQIGLSRNAKVTHAGLENLRGLRNLVYLSLLGTPVTDVGLEHLQGLTSLTYLNLYDTRIGNAGLAHLKSLTNLRTLAIYGARITNPGLEPLQGMRELRALQLSWMEIGDAGLVHLKGLTGVQSLDLRATPVSGPGLAHLKDLIELQQLKLGHTRVDDAALPLLTPLAALEKLDLERTQVTDQGLKHLQALIRLRELDLTGTKVTPAGVAELRKALPKCQVKWDGAPAEPKR